MVQSHHCTSSRSRRQLLEDRARFMRHHPTDSERAFFALVRGRRLGATVKRQVVIGNFIVDFLFPAARLIVEIDGGYHSQMASADARRDVWLQRQGYRVLRFSDEKVRRELAEVRAAVRWVLQG